MACRWMHDPGIGRWFLPDCWGGVNGGPDGCYCGEGDPAGDEVGDRLTDLEARLELLEQALNGKDGTGEE